MRIKGFKAYRPTPATVEALNSPAYDTLSTAEAVAMAAGNPLHFLHVSRPEIDAGDPFHASPDECDRLALANLRRLIAGGALVEESSPDALYVYRLTWRGRSQHGVACCVHTEDYRTGVIRKHEDTRRDKEEERTRLQLHVGAHLGPVFLAYRDDPALTQCILHETCHAPLFEFINGDVLHTVWRVQDGEALRRQFDAVPNAYIADGHHRAAAAARMAQAEGDTRPEAAWFLAVLFPASELRVLPYNRLVRGLNGHDAAGLLAALRRVGELADGDAQVPPRGQVGLYLDHRWHRLTLPPATPETAPVQRLDVSRLQDLVLEPLLGIRDPRTDKRIDFVGGIRGTAVLAETVERGAADIAFTLHPVSVADVMDVSDAGLNMPPKSTWFEPKLRSGLFVHTIRPPLP